MSRGKSIPKQNNSNEPFLDWNDLFLGNGKYLLTQIRVEFTHEKFFIAKVDFYTTEKDPERTCTPNMNLVLLS